MEQLPNGLTLTLPKGSFPLSTDSMVLAHLTRLPKNASVLDLGSGCSTLGLLLAAKDVSCTVTGIELTEDAHAAAVENIRRCSLAPRLRSICADLRNLADILPCASFSVCVSNPPIFPAVRQAPIRRLRVGRTVAQRQSSFMQPRMRCVTVGIFSSCKSQKSLHI